MFEIVSNIYIWVFLVNSESVLLLAFVKYMLYRNCTENCILKKFLEAKNPCFVTKNCSKYFYICVFILSRKQYNCLQKDFHNSRMVGRRKLSDPSFNRVFKTLSIGGKYTLLFQQIKFGLKCLIKTKKNICSVPFSKNICLENFLQIIIKVSVAELIFSKISYF